MPRSTQIHFGGEIFDSTVAPMLDPRGELTGYTTTWEIVTERVALEAALKEEGENQAATGRVLRALGNTDTVDEAARSTSKGSSEVQQASAELSRVAAELGELVGRFKI